MVISGAKLGLQAVLFGVMSVVPILKFGVGCAAQATAELVESAERKLVILKCILSF